MTTISTPPSKKIKITDITISEIIIGDKINPPVLLLHGWGANISLVWTLAQRLSTKGYCVYALDLPGFGDSDEPPIAWSVHDYVNFIIDYMNYHQLEQVNLFGHSFGGRLSLILGSLHATRVNNIVLANSAGIRPKTPLTSNLRLSAYKSIRDRLKAIGLTNLSDKLRNLYNKRYGSSDFNDTSGVMRETFVKVINEDLLKYAQDVNCPTMILWGETDEETPLWMGETLHRAINNSGLHIFPNSGHYSYIDNLDQTANIMHALYTTTE